MARYLAIAIFLTVISTFSTYGQQHGTFDLEGGLEAMKTLLNSILTNQKTANDAILRLEADVKALKEKCSIDKKEEEEDKVIGRDCKDLYDRGNILNGVYNIEIGGKSVRVKCDMQDRGWIVFQHRYDGSTDFKQTFREYEKGFGSPEREHWLGLEYLHQLTSSGRWELKVDLMDKSGKTAYAQYSDFKIGEGPGYQLNIGAYNGTAGDSLRFHNGSKFSSWDRDQDSHPDSKFHCSKFRAGAWWYNSCATSNLNAFDYRGKDYYNQKEMSWRGFRDIKGLRRSTMRIRQM